MRHLLILASIIALSAACKNTGSRKAVPVSDVHEVVVEQVLQANNYTYLFVNERGRQKWLAVPSMIASAGDTYYYKGGMVMENFESKDLDRVFESVLFLERVYATPPPAEDEPLTSEGSPHSEGETKLNLSIDPAENGISIAELYSGRKSFKGKTVIIRGAVTKFNPGIMDRNWIHLQDGTAHDGKFDLTVTSGQEAEPGEVITVKGKISLDKDFGYGYFYEVIMEDAEVIGD